VYVPSDLPAHEALTATLEQIDAYHRLVARYPADLAPARTAADVERAVAQGRIASLIGVEGGHSIGCSLGVLRILHALGARAMTLTHNHSTPWADAAVDVPRCGGLSGFGVEVVREMNRLGMLVDLSHVAATTMRAALAATRAPVVFTHSNAQALCEHPRNVPDDVLAALRGNGGVCMVTFVPGFLDQEIADVWLAGDTLEKELWAQMPDSPEEVGARLEAWKREHPVPDATLGQVADHVEHVREVAGVEHVGIGGDFDGVYVLPVGMEDGVSSYPALFRELRRRGWSDPELRLLAGRNVLRALGDAADLATAEQAERPPSRARRADYPEGP